MTAQVSVVLQINDQPYTMPQSASLPGLTPANVRDLLALAGAAGVAPGQLDATAAAKAGGAFGIEFAVTAVAMTLARTGSCPVKDADALKTALMEQNDLDAVLGALDAVKERNPRIFTPQAAGATVPMTSALPPVAGVPADIKVDAQVSVNP
jgi:hypothetical protein